MLKHGVLLGIEAGGYGQGGALVAANDGFHVHQRPEVTAAHQHDGTREGEAPGTGGTQRRDRRSGRSASTSLVHRVRPPFSAYSASVFSTVHRPLRIAGMLATLTATGGAEKWTYTPITDGTFESGVLEVYNGGEKDILRGAYISRVQITSAGLVVPEWTFDVQGIAPVLPTDVAVPAITYPNASEGSAGIPKAAGMIFTLAAGGQTFTFKSREFTFVYERDIEPRMSQTGGPGYNGAHAGFQLGNRRVSLEVLYEAVALTTSGPWVNTAANTVNPHALFEDSEAVTLALQIGTSQYYRWKINGTTSQMTDNQKDRAGAIRLWRSSFALCPSSDVLDDDFSIVTD